jgi:predicted AlkP superfamily pyrophosphatase or phosphodiesterase
MKRVAVLNIVGLTRGLIGVHTPRLQAFFQKCPSAYVEPAFPAVTCTAQANYLTGRTASDHGIVANGWYDRSLSEVHFWKQSNRLVEAPKLFESIKLIQPRFTCAKVFWWYNMYSKADWSITPRPMYPADGRKFFDVYTWPSNFREEMKADLGPFPFATFWGPAAGKKSPQGGPDAASRWIAASARWIEERHSPTLNLVYLPHLDYNLQRFGPTVLRGKDRNPLQEIIPDLRAIDRIFGELLDFFTARDVLVTVVSEYGITPCDTPIHLNREFRKRGWITIREELGLELLDTGNSKAFAVADHQIAHIYVNDPSILNEVRSVTESVSGVAEVLDGDAKRARGMDHRRAGDLVAVSREDAWFTYYYWLNDALAPDFARTVDIHRKPGYDPVELFTNPELSPLAVKARIAGRLLQKKLGFRMLMDVIPLEATLVRGSHGAQPAHKDDWPVFAAAINNLPASVPSTGIHEWIRNLVIHE